MRDQTSTPPARCKCGGTEFARGMKTNHRGKNGEIVKGRVRWQCKACKKYTTGHPAGSAGRLQHEALTELPTELREAKVCAFTYAQNNTRVHAGFFENLLAYMAFRKGQLHVIPGLYKNPNAYFGPYNQNYKPWWDKPIRPYLFAGRAELGPHIMVLGDLRVQPTATQPLTGHESISGHRTGIIGHPKLALKTIAEPQSRLPKMLTTTGAVTKQNYSISRAGKIADFHHTFGACLVEVRGDQHFIRQINAKRDGSFIDLQWEVKDGEVRPAPPAETLVMGDVHEWFIDPKVEAATFGEGGIIETLRPKRIVYHDLDDSFSVSHHHRKDPFLKVLKRETGLDRVKAEVNSAIAWVFNKTPANTEAVIVASNHNDHLLRWLRETDWRDEPHNAEFYLETALHLVRNTKMDGGAADIPDPLHYWFRRQHPAVFGPKSKRDKLGRTFRLLERSESYEVQGVDMTNHGDMGANGSRGTLRQYAKMGSKTISGHTHTFGIDEGAYSAATSSYLKRGFNQGLSTWMQGHVIQYANGKRSLIIIIDGEWRI